jgi:hypothetical protein
MKVRTLYTVTERAICNTIAIGLPSTTLKLVREDDQSLHVHFETSCFD